MGVATNVIDVRCAMAILGMAWKSMGVAPSRSSHANSWADCMAAAMLMTVCLL